MKSKLLFAMLAITATLNIAHAGKMVQASQDPFRPLYASVDVPPLNLLVLDRSHKLFLTAYDDTSDLNGDGVVDVGYKGYQLLNTANGAVKGNFAIDYYGYFDSYKCYTYSSGNKRFEPTSVTTNKQCNGTWSGDFLNYVTTTRMDALRKVLYGGYRDSDTTTDTTLRRVFVPQDGHTAGKMYTSIAVDGYDISKYTPFTVPTADGNHHHLFGSLTPGFTISTSTGSSSNIADSGVSQPPMLRYIQNSSHPIWEWISTERPVANTRYVNGGSGPFVYADVGTGYPRDYQVRVQVCNNTVGLEDNCKKYVDSSGNITYKPTGLIQQYGDSDGMRFGLLTGSYSHNLLGGILRKNIGKITDEIDETTGIIKPLATTNGVIWTLNDLRIEGQTPGMSYDCGWSFTAQQLTDGSCTAWGNPVGTMLYEAVRYYAGGGISPYAPTSAYGPDNIGANGTSTDTTNGVAKMNLPQPTWVDPYSNNNVCSRPYVTLISDINPQYDGNLPGSSFTFSTGSATSPVNINGHTLNVSTEADAMWASEFGAGATKNVTIGDNNTSATDTAPTVKTANSFKNLRGMVEEPSKQGTFYSASVAQFARTNIINPLAKSPVNTFVVALASPMPKIQIPVGNQTVTITPMAKSVAGGAGGYNIASTKTTFQPYDQIVPMYIEQIKNVPGFPSDGGQPYYRFLLNYEDQENGGDYEMDAIIEYTIQQISSTQISVKVDSLYAAGSITQHAGFTINGTSEDGAYLVVRDCDTANNAAAAPCRVGGNNPSSDVNYWMDVPQHSGTALPLTYTHTFTINNSGSTVTALSSPLWYAAKYGGFIDNNAPGSANINKLDNSAEWDANGDGVPDSYFLVSNPLLLSQQLNKAFQLIDSSSHSTAAVGAGSTGNSAQRLYVTSYNGTQWSGEVIATQRGNRSATFWDTNTSLQAYTGRSVLTWNATAKTGIPFTATALGATGSGAPTAQATAITTNPAGGSPFALNKIVNYLRGDSSNEGTSSSTFRARQQTNGRSNYLGDILDSSPYSVVPPNQYYRPEPGFASYAVGLASRPPFVLLGANDGMAHIIDDTYYSDLTAGPTAGRELMAYVPSMVYNKLPLLTQQTYAHSYFVNGQFAVADVNPSATNSTSWYTLAAGSAGFGGKGIFALDVTHVSDTPTGIESRASSIVKWEYSNNGSSSDDPDLGYIVNSPMIAHMNDGTWRVITNNGYNSTNGIAKLLLLDINGPDTTGNWSGTRLVKLNTNAGNSATVNGLSTPVGVDLDGNGTIDIIYAGDLQGNMWKFDVRSSNSANWTVAMNGQPLYVAKDSNNVPQPIVTMPAVTFHPNFGSVTQTGAGPSDDVTVVYFGTGKFLEDCDSSPSGCPNESVHNTFYGIWDLDSPVTGRGSLLQQTISGITVADIAAYNTANPSATQLTAADVANYRKIANSAAINWGTKAQPVQLGWYEDFPIMGERAVGNAFINATMVMYSTLIPSYTSNSCTFSAQSGFMGVEYNNGGQIAQRFQITKSDGSYAYGVNDVGVLSATPAPNGTIVVGSSVKASGLNDNGGFGRNYGTGNTYIPPTNPGSTSSSSSSGSSGTTSSGGTTSSSGTASSSSGTTGSSGDGTASSSSGTTGSSGTGTTTSSSGTTTSSSTSGPSGGDCGIASNSEGSTALTGCGSPSPSGGPSSPDNSCGNEENTSERAVSGCGRHVGIVNWREVLFDTAP